MKEGDRVHYMDDPNETGEILQTRREKKSGRGYGRSRNTGVGTRLVEVVLYGVAWDRDPEEVDWLRESQLHKI